MIEQRFQQRWHQRQARDSVTLQGRRQRPRIAHLGGRQDHGWHAAQQRTEQLPDEIDESRRGFWQ